LSLAAWLPDSVDPAPRADDALDRARAVASLRAVVDRLPPRQRLVWGLRFDEGWSVAEIAAATGIGPETVKTHLKRALQKVGAP
jgi:RNA polymerase sigma factor (sigma-70 family)